MSAIRQLGQFLLDLADDIDGLAARGEFQDLKDSFAGLLARVEALETKPAPVVTTPPVVETTTMVPDKPVDKVFPFAAVYVEDERAVNDAAQAKARADHMVPQIEGIAAAGLDDLILFCNPEDLKWNALPRTLADLRCHWWQSPIQYAFIQSAAEQPKFIDHLKALHDAGVYGVVFDDASDPTKTPHDSFSRMLDILAKYLPAAPVLASFAANAAEPVDLQGRYVRMSQWYLSAKESAAHWFPLFQPCQIYTANVHNDPARMQREFDVAAGLTQGVAWYGGFTPTRNVITDAPAIWEVMKSCSTRVLNTKTPALPNREHFGAGQRDK